MPNVSELIAPVYYEAHRDIKAGKHDVYWLKGGRGSANSAFLSFELLLGLYRDENANALILRRYGNTVKDSVFTQIIWAVEMLGIADQFTSRTSPYELIRKDTKQRILFRGTDDPLKLKSIKLTKGYFKYLWCEELAEFRGLEDIRSVQQSVFRGVDKAFTFYSYNPPKTAGAWVNKEALNEKESEHRYTLTTCYTDLPVEWLGRKFLDDAEELKRTNILAYRNEYLGEITGTGGNVFENVEIRTITDDEINTLDRFYQGIDWGWFPDPFQWVRVAWDAARRRLYVIDEYRANKAGNPEVYEAIKSKLTPDEELIADSAEMKSVADFREYGAWWIRGAVKGPNSRAYSMKWLASLGAIVIDDKRCPETAKEFIAYEYERTKDGEFSAGFPDGNDHAIDAVRYATSLIWRQRGE